MQNNITISKVSAIFCYVYKPQATYKLFMYFKQLSKCSMKNKCTL